MNENEDALSLEVDATRTDGRMEAFRELQRRLSLTPAKATAWQDAISEARR